MVETKWLKQRCINRWKRAFCLPPRLQGKVKPAGVSQVQYSFPQGAAGFQQVTLALQTGSGEQVLAEVQLLITAGADAVSAAHTSAEGPGLSGAVAGQPGEVLVSMRTVLTPPYMTVSICPQSRQCTR